MSLIDSMQTLKDGIKVSHGRRRQELKDIRRDTKQVQQDVSTLRQGFRKDQAEVRKEILTASSIWHGKASTKVIQEAKEGKDEE